MKIVAVETFSDGSVGIVRVRTDDGSMGWGQLSPYNADITAAVFPRQVAPHALGRDATDIDGLVARVPELDFACTDGTGGPGISSCVDQNNQPSGASIDTSTPGTYAFTVTQPARTSSPRP